MAVIVTCFIEKRWTGRPTQIAKEFRNKKWNYRSINWLLAKYRHTGTTDRKKGSGRPVIAMTNENLAEVEQLCQSQDDKPGTHKSQRQAAPHITGVSQTSVQRMLKRRRLRPFKRMQTSAVNAKTKSQVLYRRFSVATVKKIIFTDLNPLDYSIWDILQELVYEGRREPFANLKDLQNVIRDKWHDVDDQTVRKAILQWRKNVYQQ